MTRTMKDSGVEWIGKIPAKWDLFRIKNSYMVISGNGFPTSLQGNDVGKYPVYKASDISKAEVFIDKSLNYISEFIVKEYNFNIIPPKSVIFAKIGEAMKKNNRAITTRKCCLDNNCQAMISININFKFGYYIFNIMDMDWYNNGGTIPCISNLKLLNEKIPFPSLPEQQAIADYLDDKCAQIDNITATINEQIDVLKQYKKSVITEAVTKGLNPNAPMKDSGVEWIGRIPKHWEVVKLKYALENNSEKIKVGPFGSTLKTSDYVDFGKWVYNQRTVLDNNFKSNSIFISEEKYNLLSGFKVNEDDILITTRGSIGKIAIVPKHFKEGILHPCLMKFRIDRVILNYQIIKHIFNNTDFIKEQFNYMSNGTTIDVIYSYNLKEIFLPVPSIHEQQAIADYLDDKCAKIDAVIADKQAQLETLAAYKKSLIYEYVTGKKSVPGFEEA